MSKYGFLGWDTTIGLDLFAEEMDFETVPKISKIDSKRRLMCPKCHFGPIIRQCEHSAKNNHSCPNCGFYSKNYDDTNTSLNFFREWKLFIWFIFNPLLPFKRSNIRLETHNIILF